MMISIEGISPAVISRVRRTLEANGCHGTPLSSGEFAGQIDGLVFTSTKDAIAAMALANLYGEE